MFKARRKRHKMLKHKSGYRKFGKRCANRSARHHTKLIVKLADYDGDMNSRILGYVEDKMKLYHLIIIGW